jgi:phenylacetic acid degradation operon negative regulatory protein
LTVTERPPALIRRHAAGAPSARGLLFTLLGEFVLPGGGAAWTSAVIAAFARLGVAEKATRQALMRTSADGWLSAEKAGRLTQWHLTSAGRQLLTEGAGRIYSFTSAAENWDGRWLLVAARIPDGDRSTRHAVRTRLSWAGLGWLGPGLWISAHPEREAEVARVLSEAGVAGAHLFTATRSGLDGAAEMVRAAWDLDAIEQQYGRFIDDFGGPEFCGTGPGDVLARHVELVHAWRRFPAIDPGLPRELLPASWRGLAAARLFTGLHERWSAGAQAEWKRLNDGVLAASAPSGAAGGGLQRGQRDPAVVAPDDLAGC